MPPYEQWAGCDGVAKSVGLFFWWVEAMTSLGRLIFLDQPGTGASDPVTPGALPSTASLWMNSRLGITAQLVANSAAAATASTTASKHTC